MNDEVQRAANVLRAIFERAPDGSWHADVPEMPGSSVKGRTIAEARERLREAVAVYVEEPVTFEEEISWEEIAT